MGRLAQLGERRVRNAEVTSSSLVPSTSPSRVNQYARRNRTDSKRTAYFVVQGVGFQPVALGSFLKSELVRYGRVKYPGSSTLVVTVSH